MVPFTRRCDPSRSVMSVMAVRELLQSETRSPYRNGECPYIWWHASIGFGSVPTGDKASSEPIVIQFAAPCTGMGDWNLMGWQF